MKKMYFRYRSSLLLGCKGARSGLLGWSFYLMTGIISLAAAIILIGYQSSILEDGILVTGNPLNLPFLMAVIISGVYFGLAALISIARERESGTMAVLFYGPIDSVSYVGGKFLESLLTFFMMFAFYSIIFALFGWIAWVGFYAHFLQRLLIAFCFSANLIAFGALFALTANSTRIALFGMIGACLVLAGIPWLESSLSITNGLAGGFSSILDNIARSASPFINLNAGLQALVTQNPKMFLFSCANLLVWTLAGLLSAITLLSKKGVKSR